MAEKNILHDILPIRLAENLVVVVVVGVKVLVAVVVVLIAE